MGVKRSSSTNKPECFHVVHEFSGSVAARKQHRSQSLLYNISTINASSAFQRYLYSNKELPFEFDGILYLRHFRGTYGTLNFTAIGSSYL